jgi:hypothetical protein
MVYYCLYRITGSTICSYVDSLVTFSTKSHIHAYSDPVSVQSDSTKYYQLCLIVLAARRLYVIKPKNTLNWGNTYCLLVKRFGSRLLPYLSIYLSIDLYLCISIYLYLSIYIYLYLSISIYRSIYLSIYLSIYIYLSIHLSISIYLYLSISIYLYLSICTYLYLSICIYLSISIYLYLSLYLSICLYLSISLYLSIYIYVYLSIRFYDSCRRLLPQTKRHSSLFLHWFCSIFLAVMAACTPSIHVLLGRPLFRLSAGTHSRICYPNLLT